VKRDIRFRMTSHMARCRRKIRDRAHGANDWQAMCAERGRRRYGAAVNGAKKERAKVDTA
jgi:hypothetical protein